MERSTKVLSEARFGRPVVSTDAPCHLIDGESGFIVPVRDHLALAARVQTLLTDPDLRARFGARARAAAIDAFAPARIAGQTLALYRRVLAAAEGRVIEERAP